MPKSKKKKMKKKKKSAAKKPSVVGPSAEEPSTEGPSALSQLGSKITGAALVTANQIVPKIPQKEINKASQQIGKKAGSAAAAVGTAGAVVGTAVLHKVKNDPKFRKAASKLGYQILDTTKDGMYFVIRNNPHRVIKPAMKIVKHGVKLAFIPVKALGILVINAALTAASVIPPVAVAIKLTSTASKLGWQIFRAINLPMKIATNQLRMGNNIIELILGYAMVIPIMVNNLRKLGVTTRYLVNSLHVPLPPIPALHIGKTLRAIPFSLRSPALSLNMPTLPALPAAVTALPKKLKHISKKVIKPTTAAVKAFKNLDAKKIAGTAVNVAATGAAKAVDATTHAAAEGAANVVDTAAGAVGAIDTEEEGGKKQKKSTTGGRRKRTRKKRRTKRKYRRTRRTRKRRRRKR